MVTVSSRKDPTHSCDEPTPCTLSRQFETATKTLRALHILQANPGGTKLSLQPAFQKNFRLALTGGGSHMSFGVPCIREEDRKATMGSLDQHASERWEVGPSCVAKELSAHCSPPSPYFTSWSLRVLNSGQQSPRKAFYSSLTGAV